VLFVDQPDNDIGRFDIIGERHGEMRDLRSEFPHDGFIGGAPGYRALIENGDARRFDEFTDAFRFAADAQIGTEGEREKAAC
jgi:hypothetical protein